MISDLIAPNPLGQDNRFSPEQTNKNLTEDQILIEQKTSAPSVSGDVVESAGVTKPMCRLVCSGARPEGSRLEHHLGPPSPGETL